LSIIEPKGVAVTRSFRIDKAWDEAINREAEKQGTSISSLLEKIVRDYILFYRWAEKLDSVIFSPTTIREIIDALDENELRKIAERVATSTFKESYLARGDSLDLDTVRFQIIDQMGRYANWFTVNEHETSGHYFYIKHRLGDKWSVFVESYICTLIENIIGIKVETERIGPNILVKLDSS
jgi:hypothetical protein